MCLVGSGRRRADAWLSHAKVIIRTLGSNPPAPGARLVEMILSDSDLQNRWRDGLDGMRRRMGGMRTALSRGLRSRRAGRTSPTWREAAECWRS